MRLVRWLVVVAMGLIVFGAVRFTEARDDDPTALIGQKAPGFSLSTIDGKTVTLADQKGKVVVLDFWATWCAPCKAGLPHTQEMSAKKDWVDKGLVVWAVNDQETTDTVNKFLAENHYTFTVPMDSDEAVKKSFQVGGIPTVVVIGRDQVIKQVFVGYGEGADATIDTAVGSALAESAPN
jgi:peroxiredoxin